MQHMSFEPFVVRETGELGIWREEERGGGDGSQEVQRDASENGESRRVRLLEEEQHVPRQSSRELKEG